MKNPEKKKEAILDNALRIFTEKGFHGTPVPEIADAANVGAGTIYRYFKSKEDLVNAIYQKWKQCFFEFLMENYSENASEKKQFFHLWQKMAKFQKDHSLPFKFLEFHFHANYLDEKSKMIEEASHKFLIDFFEKCKLKNPMKDIPAEAMIGFCFGSFLGLVKYYEKTDKKLDEGIVKIIGEICWQGLLKR